jgi:hypothetical protein
MQTFHLLLILVKLNFEKCYNWENGLSSRGYVLTLVFNSWVLTEKYSCKPWPVLPLRIRTFLLPDIFMTHFPFNLFRLVVKVKVISQERMRCHQNFRVKHYGFFLAYEGIIANAVFIDFFNATVLLVVKQQYFYYICNEPNVISVGQHVGCSKLGIVFLHSHVFLSCECTSGLLKT